MTYFNFGGQSRVINVREALDMYLKSDVPKPITISSDLSDVFYPLKYLPVVALDKSTNDGIVMVKGTIASLVGQIEINDTPSYRFPINSGVTGTGINVLPIAQDVVNGGTVGISAKNGYWGYADDHIAVIVPANGGSDATYNYTSYDVEVGTYKYDGTLATASDTIVIPANRPIGVTMTTIFQDARGKYINYYNPANKAYGLQTTGYLSVPFVNVPKMIADGIISATTFNSTAAYNAVKTLFPFCYINSNTTLYNGMWVESDSYGRFVISSDTAPSIQTVGKFVAADFRMPKNLSEYVDSAPGSHIKGTNTGGLDKTLFAFITLILTAINGTEPTISDVVNAVTNGYIGEARILLMLS